MWRCSSWMETTLSSSMLPSSRTHIRAGAIQSGDLLGWRRNSHNSTSDFLIHAIRIATASKYGHVGIAWRCHDGVDDELLVIEATIPKIQVCRITPDADFDCVPMGIEWNRQGKDFLVDKIGEPYGILDALRGGLGKTVENDNRWQCAELAHCFYQSYDIDLGEVLTPGGIISSAEKHAGCQAYRVIA